MIFMIEDEEKRVAMRISGDLYAKLVEQSKKRKKSISEIIRGSLQDYFHFMEPNMEPAMFMRFLGNMYDRGMSEDEIMTIVKGYYVLRKALGLPRKVKINSGYLPYLFTDKRIGSLIDLINSKTRE